MICFVCRENFSAPQLFKVETLLERPVSTFAYGLCHGCYPYWLAAAPVLERGAESGPRGSCFYCMNRTRMSTDRWCLYDWGGWVGRAVEGLRVEVCAECRRTRLEEARQLAQAARGVGHAAPALGI